MLKKAFRSVVSFAVVLCLLLGMSGNALAVLAADLNKDPDVNKDGKINYVSLGDSMSNGYGLPGYDRNSGVEDYGDGSYANLFEQWLEEKTGAEVDHAQLAMSGIRAEDLHWLLEVDYNDRDTIMALTEGAWAGDEAWNAAYTTGDYWTWNEICTHSRTRATTDAILATGYTDYPEGYNPANKYNGDVALIAKYFQEHVAAADIVSLGVGNGNFGVFMFGRIMEAVGFDGTPSDAMIYDVENAIRECEPEVQEKLRALIAELYTAIETKTGPIAGNATLEALVNTVIYAAVSYVLNYAGTVEAILQLNPDAEIILVGLMNTMATKEKVEGISLGDIMGAVFAPLNVYIAALPTYMQATENGVYAEAKFYYAEAPYVECLVDTYVEAIANNDPIVRDRFVESIVGYCDHETECTDVNACTKWENGMVWDLLDNSVVRITLEDIVNYEPMSDVVKAANLASNPEDAAYYTSIAMYLAFEKAVVAGKDNAVTLDSVLELTKILDGDPFGAIMKKFKDVAAVAGPAKLPAVSAGMAMVVEAMLESEINALLNGAATVDVTVTADQILAVLGGVDGAAEAIASNAVKNITDATSMNEDQLNYVLSDQLNQTITAKAYIAGMIGAAVTADNAELICMLLVMPEELSAVVAESELAGLLALFARCIIGNGLGAHPSANGHNALADAVIEAYANDFTAQDKTIQNLKLAAGLMADLVAEYYDDAYAYAYANSGEYIAAANTAIDAAIAKLAALDLSESEMTPAFKAEVAGEVEEIIEALTAAKALLNGADVLDQETLDLAVAALKEAGEAVANLEKLLAQAGADVTELVIVPAIEAAIEYVEEVAIPTAIEAVEKIAEEALNYLVENLAEALKAELEGLKAQLENASAELKAEIESAIAEIESAIAEIEATIAEIEKAGTELKAELAAKLKAQVEKLLNDAVAELIAILTDVFNNATHTDYQINENSSYVAIGDNTAYAELLNAYLAEVVTGTDKAGYKYPAATLIQSATIAGAPAAIQSNLAAIAGADLISIGYGNDTFATQAIDAMMAALIEGEFAEYDWVALLGEDGAAYAAEAMAELYSKLVAMGLADVVIPTAKASLADAMMAAVESYIYNVAVYGLYLPEIIAAIQEINPDAQIIVVGMSNPFTGTVFTFEDMAINVGEYVQYVVDAANIYGVTYAVLTENVTFVPAPEAESAVSNQTIEMGLAFVASYIKGEVTFATTEAGNAYIAEQIMNALTVTVETVGLLGDADNDGDVDIYDAQMVLAYVTGDTSKNELIDLTVSDVDADSDVDIYDAQAILAYVTGGTEKLPAE